MNPKRKLLAAMISAGLIWNTSALALNIPPDILNEIQQQGAARVIVELDVPWQPEGMLRGAEAVVAQRQQLADTQQQFVTQLSQDLVNSGLFDDVNSGDGTPLVKPEATYETIPYLVLEVSEATLPLVQQQSLSKSLSLDHADEPSLTQSLPLIGADKAWSYGATGKGQSIAVLDTGVEKSHSFFASNRVVQEACFSATLCPNGQKQQIGAGAAVPCSYDTPACSHGTHVAGIAASVAKEAQIVAVQVFSKQLGMAKSLQSDQLLALDWLHKTYGNPDSKLAAVNLSLGGGKFASACDDDPRKKAIDNLRSVGIATIVSSGNQGYSDGMNAPACISSAISVGATDKADTLWASSNSASLLNLLAPGVDIVSSVPGGKTLAMSGTSMAAPQVAGVWAVLKAAKPTATVDEVLTTLQSTGKAVTGKGVTKARVQLDAALPPPVATAPSCDARTQLLDAVTNTGMCGIKPDGKVGCWGVPVNADTSTQPDDSFLQISGDGSDYGYVVGVREDGTVKGWNGTAYPIEGQFTQVQGIRGALGGGGYALRTNGVLSSWMRANLFRVTPPGTFTQVNGQCALKTDGKAVCWGGNQYGQAIPPSDTFVYVVGGSDNSCGIKTDGTLLCWGLNNQTSPATAGTFTPFPGTFSQVDLGTFNCAIRTNGTLACWGDYLRYVILPPATETFTQISAGYARFCGIKTDGTASCWGHSSVTPLLPSGLKLKTCGTINPTLPTTLTVTPATEGTVISTDIKCGINGTSCSAQLPANLPVGLEAKPAPGYKFAKWSGDCQGTSSFVRITLDKAKSCSASFTQVTPSTSCSNNADGLVACYRFSENAEDNSGYGNHGEFVNGTTLTEDRFANAFSAYKLDGVDDYMKVNDDPSIRMDGNFTVVAWIKGVAAGNNIIEGISGNEPYPVASWILSGGTYYVPKFTISNTQTDQLIVSDPKVLPSQEWTQLAGVWDQQTKTIALYRNGVKVKSDMQQVLTRYIHTKGLIIGKHGNDYAPGSIDDIRIFNRVLSDNEVKQLYDFDMNKEAAKVTLTVTKTGNGQITGNGITCGTDCTEDLAPNTQVTLTATATTGAMFKQWTGDCTGTTATVTVTMDKAKTCAATFDQEIKYTLTVTTTGNGTVTGPGDYPKDTPVTLTATPATGYTFKDWTGDCTGTTTPLTVTMDKAKTCIATFEPIPTGLPLTVKKADADRGRISGRLRGEAAVSLTCDNACQTANYNYPKDGVVILSATADKGFEFKTWTCTGSSYAQDPATPNILKVTMTTATTCTANFDAIPGQLATLTVNLIGTGNGTVISNKAGLTCSGQSCTGTYLLGQKLTLTATPSVFATFLNWGSDCTGNNAKVSLTLTKDLTCTAQFQSILEAAATELVKVLYTDGFLENKADVASQFSQATNQDRLKEAFWLAVTAILQADSNLAATQQWPAQLNSIPWYSKSPIGQYTESIQLQAGEYVDIQLKLLDNAGVEQEVVIVIYYGDTPPTPVGDSGSGRYSIPIYIPKSFASQWGW